MEEGRCPEALPGSTPLNTRGSAMCAQCWGGAVCLAPAKDVLFLLPPESFYDPQAPSVIRRSGLISLVTGDQPPFKGTMPRPRSDFGNMTRLLSTQRRSWQSQALLWEQPRHHAALPAPTPSNETGLSNLRHICRVSMWEIYCDAKRACVKYIIPHTAS